jgi:hypothetical protein
MYVLFLRTVDRAGLQPFGVSTAAPHLASANGAMAMTTSSWFKQELVKACVVRLAQTSISLFALVEKEISAV